QASERGRAECCDVPRARLLGAATRTRTWFVSRVQRARLARTLRGIWIALLRERCTADPPRGRVLQPAPTSTAAPLPSSALGHRTAPRRNAGACPIFAARV